MSCKDESPSLILIKWTLSQLLLLIIPFHDKSKFFCIRMDHQIDRGQHSKYVLSSLLHLQQRPGGDFANLLLAASNFCAKNFSSFFDAQPFAKVQY